MVYEVRQVDPRILKTGDQAIYQKGNENSSLVEIVENPISGLMRLVGIEPSKRIKVLKGEGEDGKKITAKDRIYLFNILTLTPGEEFHESVDMKV